jgi:arsenate reductase
MAGGGDASRVVKCRVLFLCTDNPRRSQMAEAIVNARLGDAWEAFSAGTEPADNIHPKTLASLAEIGIRHSGRPKGADEFRGVDFDLLVTLCDDAAENCPVWLGKGKRLHIGFPDPAEGEGTDEEITTAFRKVRDNIAREMSALLEKHEN